ncbi:pantoate--beta-alanine ligase [candidate division WOR-3 bacterium 4484_100]|uniref:Pantothenate synthetase n=1 Tax=candidate division WOR-3 bacterium 4484_100 TaxID=1936077 RepID=A0A1V4QFA0_UNCW3|nr:MAG: pantoate--beta-alanine ligase [candidate division WOR-3 bacterium 4484_100]
MRVFKRISQIRKTLQRYKKRSRIIGFVPTMGYLHKGHLSLIKLARKKSQVLVVSIFVNPTQFGPKEDYHRYPRDLNRDLKLLKEEGVDIVFYPSVKEMYPEGYKTYVEVRELSQVMCGISRPTHFCGVTTVVLKLFNIIEPDLAVFGRKDFQQAVIIKRMVKDLNLPIRILTGPIIREPDGLAMSSRNIYLNKIERQRATILFKSLKWAKESYKRGNPDPKKIIRGIKQKIKQHRGRIDYVVAVDKNNLQPVNFLRKGTLIALAVYFGKTRLIDNIIL